MQMKMIVSSVVLTSILALECLALADPLGDAYETARGFNYGTRSASPAQASQWQANRDAISNSSGNLPQTRTPENIPPPYIPPPPPPGAIVALNKAMDKQIERREKKISKLNRTIAAWQIALEQASRRKDYEKELNEWVSESQSAQFGALMTSSSLLLGALGPLEQAMNVHGYNSATLYSKIQQLQPRLDQAKELALNARRRGKNVQQINKVIIELNKVRSEFITLMKKEMALHDLMKLLGKTSEKTLLAATLMDGVSEANSKEDLFLAIKTLEGTFRDILKDAVFDKLNVWLQKESSEGTGQVIKLLNFSVDYGYNSVRFYESWNQVHSILSSADDRDFLLMGMQITIKRQTDERTQLKQEITSLRSLMSDSNSEKKRRVLSELRAIENHQAYLQGEWYSQQTGVRAPGRPIFPEGG